MTMLRSSRHARRGALATTVAGLMLLAMPSCQIAGIAGIAADAVDKATPERVYAEYTGLRDHSYAVLVAADMAVQAESPGVVSELTARITNLLVANNAEIGAVATIDPNDALLYQLRNPSWQFSAVDDLSEDLGVDRIILVELDAFRLREPGNRYLWEGEAIASVIVKEADGDFVDESAFVTQRRVTFPDGTAYTSDDFSAVQIQSVLIQRLSDRVAWLFFDHDESKELPY